MKSRQKASQKNKDRPATSERQYAADTGIKGHNKKTFRRNNKTPNGWSRHFVLLGFVVPALSGILYILLSKRTSQILNQSVENVNQGQATVRYGDGGWERASSEDEQLFNTSFCNIERRFADDLLKEEFERDYRLKKPVLIRFRNGAAGWTKPDRWTKQSLMQEYGRWEVDSGRSDDIVKAYGNGDIQSSFAEFLKFMHDPKHKLEPLYMFDRSFYEDSDLPKTISPPPYLEIQDELDGSIFLLGASRSGVSFHKHADAWNGVVFGRKRWFLYSPTKTPPGGVYPSFTQQDWIKKVYPNLKQEDMPTLECIQEAGEILYIPESYYHGTVNIGETVAIGIQKKSAKTRLEEIIYEAGKIEKNVQEKELQPDHPNVQQIVDLYKELVDITPNSTEALHKLSVAYANAGKARKAVKILEKVVKMDPLFVNARVDLGRFYLLLGDYQGAEEMFLESLKMTPGNVDANRHYAGLLENQGQYKEAAERYRAIIKTKPELPIAYISLSNTLEKSGDWKGAKEAKKHAFQLIKEQESREQMQSMKRT